jgi:hypothetical protein
MDLVVTYSKDQIERIYTRGETFNFFGRCLHRTQEKTHSERVVDQEMTSYSQKVQSSKGTYRLLSVRDALDETS